MQGDFMTEQEDEVHNGGALHGQVTLAMLTHRLSQADLARDNGLSTSTISQWLKGAYRGDNAAIEAKLRAWLASRPAKAEAEGATLTDAPAWVDTPTGQAIDKALAFARARRKIAVVYGGAGVGKTTALRRYARHTPATWIVTASPAIGSMAALLRELCRALELSASGWKNSALSTDIVRRLALEPSLLIVDEAQHLSIPALEQLRYIHDQAGAGLVLCGNESVYSRLTGGNRRAEFAQLFSRVGRRLRLSQPGDADVAAVLDAWQIAGKAERAYATDVATLPGGLRGLFNLLEEATLAARGLKQPLDLRLLRMAWADLGGAS